MRMCFRHMLILDQFDLGVMTFYPITCTRLTIDIYGLYITFKGTYGGIYIFTKMYHFGNMCGITEENRKSVCHFGVKFDPI